MLLGIGDGGSASGAWWKEAADEDDAPGAASSPLVMGRQARLFDDDGSVSADLDSPAEALVSAAPASTLSAAPDAHPIAVAVPSSSATGIGRVMLLPQTEISVRAKNRRTARVVATTRARPRDVAAAAAAPVAAAVPAKGALIRSLEHSNAISRGQDEFRWLSVPRRTRLPRYRLFVGTDAVSQDRRTGVLTVCSREMRVARGRVWFG